VFVNSTSSNNLVGESGTGTADSTGTNSATTPDNFFDRNNNYVKIVTTGADNATVDAGQTRTYVIIVDSTKVDTSANQNSSWQIELSHIVFDIDGALISTGIYENMGPNLPFIRSGSAQ